MKKITPFAVLVLIPLVFFWQFFIEGLLPIPADTIVGLYHPFRDLYAKDYPRGIPFKNFLITDPVRQQYPWKELAISIEKKWELPLWNPYSFSGTPLVANFQSAAFYPLNILFFMAPFYVSWSFFVLLAPILAGIFLYLYLQSLGLNKWASIYGSIVFSFSGFFVSWLDWGNVLHTGLWLSLILLSIDKIIISKLKSQNSKLNLKSKNLITWSLIYVFSLSSSFLAGHLQTFFYLFVFSFIYFFARWMQVGRQKKILFLFIILNSLFIILSSIQWLPTLQFIFLSGRNLDQIPWQNPGWFIPWQNLIQFIVPDFFGNPTTLNYWGIFNYGEFIGYVGIAPLIFSLYALFLRRDKKTFLFGSLFFVSLIFSLPTIFAKIPYFLNAPFINTAQPTRLLFLTDFSLAILVALGFDYFLKIKNKKEIFYPLGFVGCLIISLWGFALHGNQIVKNITSDNLSVAKHNLILPTTIFVIVFFLLLIKRKFQNINNRITIMIYIIIVVITVFDLLRFGLKFTPFTKKEYLFPTSKILSFLQKQNGFFRVMSTDSRILPPNFSIMYKLQTVDGYDPLYLRRYGELIAASERGEPNISPPFGFNRIITPHNYSSKIMDLLGVKYVLSLSDLASNKHTKIFQEGETRLYGNKNVIPRVFFVEKTRVAKNKHESIKFLFDISDYSKEAIIEDTNAINSSWRVGDAKITGYSPNRIVVETENSEKGFLLLTDTFYPSWKVEVDGQKTKIYLTDFNFRGIIVPEGKHGVVFYNSLL